MSISLSQNFSLSEFTRSQTADSLGRIVICEPDSPEYANLVSLCRTVLQPLREALQRKITVTSGYRPFWLNTAIGGAAHSAHTEGRAADIVVAGMSSHELAEFIVKKNLPFDQCIQEFERWVHVSVAAKGNNPRKNVLTASKENGITVYKEGL